MFQTKETQTEVTENSPIDIENATQLESLEKRCERSSLHEDDTDVDGNGGGSVDGNGGGSAERHVKATDVPLYRALRPLIVSMKIFGLFHEPTLQSLVAVKGPFIADADHGNRGRSWKIGCGFGCLYHLFVTCCLWVYFLRYIPGFWNFDTELELYLKIVYGTWMFQCSCNATIIYLACRRVSKLPKFLLHWHLFCDGTKMRAINDRLDKKYLRKKSLVLSVACLILIFVNIAATGYVSLSPNIPDNVQVFASPWRSYKVALGLLFFHAYSTAAWLFPVIFFIVVSLAIIKQFEKLFRDFSDDITRNDGYAKEIEEFRLWHLHLCEAVAIVDDIFSSLTFIAYLTNIPLAIFLLYQVLFLRLDSAVPFIMHCYWILCNTANVALISWFSAELNDQAHSLLRIAHFVRIRDPANDLRFQMYMLVSKLTGPAVGISASGLVVVTKGLILTVVGVFATYFTLLIQFEMQ
ncbi:gustatory receptor for sugar taste 64f-like [Ptychodera flava]|uniref:gustatory receptor for sugar taste 64f-like n=1 Tax=Ptychodera flava TaxID=63121 RepID=UPI003969BD1F